jgi:DNA-binding beta-propeller fold protein YncE
MSCERSARALVVLASTLGPLGCGSSSDDASAANKPATVASTVDGGVHGEGGAGAAGVPTLFYLDLLGGRVVRVGTDGAKPDAIVTTGNAEPDGVAVDVAGGHVYWTNMGAPQGITQGNDGYILRADLDGSNVTPIVPMGGTHTPKQMKLDAAHGKIYWSDREGMRVMRANVDGSNIETLVTTAPASASADMANWAVGIALDLAGGKMYWTQKGPGPTGGASTGSVRRAALEIPAAQDSTNRSDIEVLFSGLPEPIDLDLDLDKRQMYWTDRGDNTVSRAPMDPPAGADPAQRTDRDILVHGAGQAIGIALDLPNGVMYYTALDTGAVSKANLDGSGAKTLVSRQGGLSGITLALLPN